MTRAKANMGKRLTEFKALQRKKVNRGQSLTEDKS